MRTFVRTLAFASTLTCASPLLAEELVVSDLKAFTASIDRASERCDIDAVVDRISPIATISGNGFAQGDMRMFRMNKTQYQQLWTRTCAAATSHAYQRTNEKITIEGDQAIITADVAETLVLNGQEVSTKTRERAVVELIDGKLMLVQLLSNQVESNVAQR